MLSILKFIEENILISGIVGFITLLGGFLFNLERIINFSKKFIKIKKFGIKDFSSHPIFNLIDNALRSRDIKKFSNTRNKIANELKSIKLDVYKNKINLFINEDFRKLDKNDIINKAKDILCDYSIESEEIFKKLSHNKEEEEVADLIIKKFYKFEFRQINNALMLLEQLINDVNIKKKNEIVDNVLTSLQFLIINIINDTEDTFSMLNGDLNGKVFMGMLIDKNENKI